GKVIPEQVFTKTDYYERIFKPINEAIKHYDTENILDHHFLNSRGAIARFDRNAIEIRVIDLQECPKADVAIAVFIIEVLKLLVSEELISLQDQMSWHEDELFNIFNKVIVDAEETRIENAHFLNIFDLQTPCRVGNIWKKVYHLVKDEISEKHREPIEIILENGSLSTRILKALDSDLSADNINIVYSKLGTCLSHNTLFIP